MIERNVRDGNNSKELDFDQPVVNIGSHPENDIAIVGQGILPFHAMAFLQDGAYHLTCLSPEAQISVDGAAVNGENIILAERQNVMIGDYAISFQRNGTPTSMHASVSMRGAGSGIKSKSAAPVSANLGNEILVNVISRLSDVEVGQSASYELEVVNAGPIVAGFSISLEGVPDDWIEIAPRTFKLNEGQRATVRLTVTPPRDPGSSAGKHPLNAVISSSNYAGLQVAVPLDLFIQPYYEFSLGNLSPKQQNIFWRRRFGVAKLPITNLGNGAADFTTSALDDENGCSFDFQVSDELQLNRQATFNVPAGSTMTLPIEITPLKRPVFAMRSKRYQYTTTVQVTQQAVSQQVVSGSVTSYPLFGWWSIVLSVMALLLGIFILVQPYIRNYSVVAGKDVIELGDTTKLEWAVSPFATRVNISSIDQAIAYGQTSLTVAPKQSTTYELVAGNWLSGLLGLDRKGIKTVLVVPPSPTVNVFEVDNTRVARGKAVNVRWSVTQADKAILTIGGVVYELPPDKFSGEQSVVLDKNSLVTLDARNASGSELRSYYINVVDPNIIVNKFIVWVRPQASLAGIPSQPSLVSFLADQLAKFSISHKAAPILNPSPLALGAPAAADNFTERYVELVSDKSSDSGYRVEFYQPKRELAKGEQVMIQWDVQGTDADTVQIAPFTDVLPNIGEQPFFPQESMNFVLTAQSGEKKGLFMLPVVVFDGAPPVAPKIDIFKASPMSMTGGQNVQFAWSVSGEWTRIQLTSGKGVVADNMNPEGFKTVSVTQSDTFVLKAWNGTLSSSSALDITVNPSLIETPLKITSVYPTTGIFVTGDKISVTVEFPSLSSDDPAPTGTVIVSDGQSSCTFTLPVKTCNLIFTTPGSKRLTASYGGDTIYVQTESAKFPASPAVILVTSATVEMLPLYFTLNSATTPASAGTSISDITASPLSMDVSLYIKVQVKPVSSVLPSDLFSRIKFSLCDQNTQGIVLLATCHLITQATVTVDSTGNSGVAAIIIPSFPKQYLSTGKRAFLFEYRHDNDALIPATLPQPNVNFGKMRIALGFPFCTDPITPTGCEVGGTDTTVSSITFDINKADGTPLSTDLLTPDALFTVFDDVGGTAPNHTWACSVITQGGAYKLACKASLVYTTTAGYTFKNSQSKNYYMGSNSQLSLFTGTPFKIVRKAATQVSLDSINTAKVGQTITLTSASGGIVHLLDASGNPLSGAASNKLTITFSDPAFFGVSNAGPTTCLANAGVLTIFSSTNLCNIYFKKQGTVSLTLNFLGDGNYYPSSAPSISVTVGKQDGLTATWQYIKTGSITYSDWDITSWKPAPEKLSFRILLGGPADFDMNTLTGQVLNIPYVLIKVPPGIGTCNGGGSSAFALVIKKSGSDYFANSNLDCSIAGIELLLGPLAIGTGTDFTFATNQSLSKPLVIADRPTVNLTVAITRVAGMDNTITGTALKPLFAGEKYTFAFTAGTLFADAFTPPATIQGSINYYTANTEIKIDLPPQLEALIDWTQSDCESSTGANDLFVKLSTATILQTFGYAESGTGIHDIQVSNTPCTLVFRLDQLSSYTYTPGPGELAKFTISPTLTAPNYTYITYAATQQYTLNGLGRQAVSAVFSPAYFSSTPPGPADVGVKGDADKTISMTLTPTSGVAGSSLSPLNTGIAYTQQVSLSSAASTCTGMDLVPGSISSSTIATAILKSPAVSCSGASMTMNYLGNEWFLPIPGYATISFTNPPATTTTITAPATGSSFTHGATVTFSATVAGTGIPTGTVEFISDKVGSLGAPIPLAAGTASLTTSALSVATHSITAVYLSNNSTSFGSSTSTPATSVTINPAATNTSLTSSPIPTSWTTSSPVTFTATVTRSTSPNAGTPVASIGSVDFYDGANKIGTDTLNASGIAQIATTFTLGNHAITAVYLPSPSLDFSTSTSNPLTQNITLPTSVGLISNQPTYVYGTTATFTATVTYPAAAPTGNVVFKDAGATIGTTPLLASDVGVAQLTIATLAAGPGGLSHPSITATFVPGVGSIYSGNTSPNVAVTITQAPTTITITSSSASSVYGDTVTYGITVVPGTLAGTAQFKDGGANLGSAAAVAAGTGTFSNASLAVAGSPHTITAVFNPTDTNYAPSTSNPLPQTVTAAATTSSVVTITPASPTKTTNLTLSVDVTATVTTGLSNGSVEFFANGASMGVYTGSVPIVGGITYTLTGSGPTAIRLNTGTYLVTAVYTDSSGNFSTSTSSPVLSITIP